MGAARDIDRVRDNGRNGTGSVIQRLEWGAERRPPPPRGKAGFCAETGRLGGDEMSGFGLGGSAPLRCALGSRENREQREGETGLGGTLEYSWPSSLGSGALRDSGGVLWAMLDWLPLASALRTATAASAPPHTVCGGLCAAHSPRSARTDRRGGAKDLPCRLQRRRPAPRA